MSDVKKCARPGCDGEANGDSKALFRATDDGDGEFAMCQSCGDEWRLSESTMYGGPWAKANPKTPVARLWAPVADARAAHEATKRELVEYRLFSQIVGKAVDVKFNDLHAIAGAVGLAVEGATERDQLREELNRAAQELTAARGELAAMTADRDELVAKVRELQSAALPKAPAEPPKEGKGGNVSDFQLTDRDGCLVRLHGWEDDGVYPAILQAEDARDLVTVGLTSAQLRELAAECLRLADAHDAGKAGR